MQRRHVAQGLLSSFLWPSLARAQRPAPLQEVNQFSELVAAGSLPPVAKRVPEVPSIVKDFTGGDGSGRSGGEIVILIATERDTRLMTLYANARLIVYDETFKLHADILDTYDVRENRIFTLRLRAGHKWSDGVPFTTEDFRYFWEDVANNEALSPTGPSVELIVDGRPPEVEIIDPLTIRYSWHKPNPYFIESQARAAPLWLFRPAHYLKNFHIRYADPEEIAARAQDGGSGDWVQIHRRLDVMYANNNPDLPTLNPWRLTTAPPARRFVFERNPYYYRIDYKGVQLPYLDRVVFSISAANLIPAKAGLGEADLQPRYLNMRDYTFLKNAASSSGIRVFLWEKGSCSEVAFYPNLNTNDDAWRRLNRDVRYRRALSLAINRAEINEIVYFGLGKPSNNTILERSPLFERRYATEWARYDPVEARRLLDECGLDKTDGSGRRLLPDGRVVEFVVEHTTDESSEIDTMTLVMEYWSKVGVKIALRPQTRENFRLRTFSGETIMTAYSGLTTAAPTTETSPKEFAPTMLGGLQWPKWGLYAETSGKQGEPCDMPQAQALLKALRRWEEANLAQERRSAWETILSIAAEQVFSIGTVNGTMEPIVVGPKVRNVPEKGYWAWDPGGYIGLYKPDTFWAE